MTDTVTTPKPKPKPKPGAWAAATEGRDLPVSFVPTTDPRIVRATDLIAREAELLDQKSYEPWQQLYSDDALYVIPIDPDEEDFANSLNMVYDDARMRQLRVTRMTEGYAIAAVDSATTARTVSRFVPAGVVDTEDGSTVEVRAAQVLIAYKRGRHDIWAANVDYTIRVAATAQEDKIVRKVIRLIDGRDEVPAAGFLL
ncbi:3-phenylpropionate/cinnamic acid dioxygenase small subunit [Williamsia muralis]|uniref:3-phenylpropionate/cinnamic acid dioxygenase small subunit n=1 Tax=Williamsia marianensis TaxID=85044 RepID=A0A495K8B4_WILMA|nr:aromatic-ring-hydroxylating dioxygenase subunit beta [Williamsia muralis]RKR96794.1 3-phenylpropionate/cinnamic acid dioxygenase small subunit [Williamsia muralis]